jgi:tetratricopeptide (TPR) repeat protein
MIHLQLAEAGRRRASRGDHAGALDRYRRALATAVRMGARPVFLHHYTACILDALEASGARAQALELIERALAERADAGGALGARVRAELTERRVVCFYALGREAEADAALAQAAHLGGPVLAALGRARARRHAITRPWLDDLLRRHGRGRSAAGALRQADAEAGERHFEREMTGG